MGLLGGGWSPVFLLENVMPLTAVSLDVPLHADRVRDPRRTNYHAGVSAEHSVARHYARLGAVLRETRWRGPGGEIDLIFAEGDGIVFVEVKKSRTHAQAAQRLSQRQMARILLSAEAYLDRCPEGSLTEARLDLALVDACGAIEIVPNASMAT